MNQINKTNQINPPKTKKNQLKPTQTPKTKSFPLPFAFRHAMALPFSPPLRALRTAVGAQEPSNARLGRLKCFFSFQCDWLLVFF